MRKENRTFAHIFKIISYERIVHYLAFDTQ